MLRFLHALVFALAAVFGTASGVCALGPETALRGNFGICPWITSGLSARKVSERVSKIRLSLRLLRQSPHMPQGGQGLPSHPTGRRIAASWVRLRERFCKPDRE